MQSTTRSPSHDKHPQSLVRLEAWSVPQCVWCFIAHPRFVKAVAAFEGEVEVTYRSFELRPDAPVEIDKEQQTAQHAGANRERVDAINAQLTALAEAEGLSYRPDLSQPTNSRFALELLHQAGQRATLTSRLFSAHFSEGCHIGRIDELLALAHEVGLDRETARAVLTERRHRKSVERDHARLRALGARGVPLYVINGQPGISGAQPVQTYFDALERAAAA